MKRRESAAEKRVEYWSKRWSNTGQTGTPRIGGRETGRAIVRAGGLKMARDSKGWSNTGQKRVVKYWSNRDAGRSKSGLAGPHVRELAVKYMSTGAAPRGAGGHLHLQAVRHEPAGFRKTLFDQYLTSIRPVFEQAAVEPDGFGFEREKRTIV
jgi:hypothetical protein